MKQKPSPSRPRAQRTATTVWVVEQGCYSDYRVVGVFSAKADADYIANAINAPAEDKYVSDEATVAEWPLNPAVNDLRRGYAQFNVTMRRDGTTERCVTCDFSGYDIAGSAHIWQRTQAPAYQGTGTPDALQATVWAKDATHAVKIVNEKRTRMIANGEWAE